MAFYIRDDREQPGYRGHGSPIISPKLTMHRHPNGETQFIHSAPTVMHDACAKENGIYPENGPIEERFKARDKWAAQFGAGQALCWSPIWSLKEDAAPCYFCGIPVKGKG